MGVGSGALLGLFCETVFYGKYDLIAHPAVCRVHLYVLASYDGGHSFRHFHFEQICALKSSLGIGCAEYRKATIIEVISEYLYHEFRITGCSIGTDADHWIWDGHCMCGLR